MYLMTETFELLMKSCAKFDVLFVNSKCNCMFTWKIKV